MELLPFWVYEIVYAIDKYEFEHSFPTGDNGVKCFYGQLLRIPKEQVHLARQLVPYVDSLNNKANGMVPVV